MFFWGRGGIGGTFVRFGGVGAGGGGLCLDAEGLGCSMISDCFTTPTL